VTPGALARVATLFRQDLRGWVRERVFFALSFAGVLVYAGISTLLPDTVDETLRLGVRLPPGAPELVKAQPGLEVTRFHTTDALLAALRDGAQELLVGLDFADDAAERVLRGEAPRVDVHVGPRAPPAVAQAARVMVTELALAALGRPLPVTLPDPAQAVRGRDRIGQHASARAKMRPLAALLVLGLEMMSLASLLSRELQLRTVVAVLATPATPAEWILAKLGFGTLVALSQALLLLVLIGALAAAPFLLLGLVVLGALLFTGLGMLAGTWAKDFTGVLFGSFALLVPSIVPAFAVLLPGATSPVVKLLPTYPLAVALFQASSGASVPAVAPYAGWTAAWVLLLLGVFALRRKVARL
jgi:ABC-2 type transport system permease protein